MHCRTFPAVLTATSAAVLLLGGCQYDQPRDRTAGTRGDVYQVRGEEPVGGSAQQLRQQAGRADERQGRIFGIPAMAFPTGDEQTSLIGISARSMQDEVRVGQPFIYRMVVTNLSNELTLDNVIVHQDLPQGIEVADVSPPQLAEGERGQWQIGTLSPGETRQFEVAVVAQEPGQFESCLRVSYEPVLCTVISVVAPQLQLRRETPELLLVCDPIPVRYTVANTGTGTTAPVVIREQLPEGITGPRGENTVNIEVGPLAAGQEEVFEVRLTANRPGELAGEAIALTQDGMEARAESRPMTIVAPQLEIQIRGPEAQFTERPMEYIAVVRNTGQGPALNAAIRLDVEGRARVVESTILRPAGPVQNGAGQNVPGGAQPPAGAQQGGAQPRQAQPGRPAPTGQMPQRAARTPAGPGVIPLGDIGPGQEVEVGIVLMSMQPGMIRLGAMATAYCAENPVQQVQTEVRGITSLLLELVDTNDPVRLGEEEIYRISVTNQGSIADQNVRIQAQVPQGFEVINVSGPSAAEIQNGRLIFAPIETLPPGQRATWTVRVIAREAGDHRFAVELTSNTLETPVIANEATRAY
jgi:uncharacterized repeat protein (TIGR01451 family)